VAQGTPDKIERQLLLKASIERVWAAITTAEGLANWFPDKVELDLRPGGEAWFTSDQYGRDRVVIEVVDPPHRFAWTWKTGLEDWGNLEIPVEEAPHTRVEFTLEAVGDMTRLHFVESGFASLPADRVKKAREDNTEGWTEALAELEKYINGVASKS
jgi:uncharacterized protein YndB with AHSA1/START domain